MKKISVEVKENDTYIKEDSVTISISIVTIYTIKSLRKLDIAEFLS